MATDVEIHSVGKPMVEFAGTKRVGLAATPGLARVWGGDPSNSHWEAA